MTLRQMAVWLRRIGHCRGFGVQSPSAYSFIRYVINEHHPYYAYEDLSKTMPHVKGTRLKLCRLYLRLANYMQGNAWMFSGEVPAEEKEYISRGCKKTSVIGGLNNFKAADFCHQPTPFVALYTEDCNPESLFALIKNAPNGSLLVVEGIGHDNKTRELWRKTVEDEHVSVSFDLYYCGIAFFDKRAKQNYIVNF